MELQKFQIVKMSLRINSNFNLETNNKIFWEDYYMRSKIRSLNTNSMRKLDMSLYVKNLFVVFWLVFFERFIYAVNNNFKRYVFCY